jgi:hypothetical protein
VNEGTNPTLCTDSLFFSSSFHGFSRGDDCVAQRLWGKSLCHARRVVSMVDRLAVQRSQSRMVERCPKRYR